MGKIAIRTYDRNSSIVFLKTQDRYGGLSNMAGGYPICINDIRILTSEALYQACRFPHHPEVQKLIISQTSPMTAKMRSKPFRSESRADWMRVRVRIMRWCLTAKLLNNWTSFSSLLLETKDHPIVEESRRDRFWGAVPDNNYTLTGANILGRLLMELRENIKDSMIPDVLPPLQIEDFLILGSPVSQIRRQSAIYIKPDGHLL
jgi:ribA/ribD-fused uncharacterized protein